MNIRVSVEVAPLLLRLRNGEKRLAFATVNALNKTALRIQQAERDHLDRAFEVRRPEFLRRQVAVIKRESFASVRAGRAFVEIAVGQKPRLLLSSFEQGGERRPFKGKRVAVPLTGSPARPSFASAVPTELRFRALRLVRVRAGEVTRTRAGRARRERRDVGFTPTTTRAGRVQWKGAHRTFLLEQTAKLPHGGVFQRVGPGRDDVRLLYPFVSRPRLEAKLQFVEIARGVADRYFGEELQRQAIEALARSGGR